MGMCNSPDLKTNLMIVRSETALADLAPNYRGGSPTLQLSRNRCVYVNANIPSCRWKRQQKWGICNAEELENGIGPIFERPQVLSLEKEAI